MKFQKLKGVKYESAGDVHLTKNQGFGFDLKIFLPNKRVISCSNDRMYIQKVDRFFRMFYPSIIIDTNLIDNYKMVLEEK